jgi:aspartyl-tRNA(Asn)/glutamyl-tRNA(Gln) amidotransferase subunit C
VRGFFLFGPYTRGMANEPRPLSEGDVRKVARLSRLAITDEQARVYQGQLAHVLGYIERVRGVDLSGVEPLTHVSGAVNRLDADVPGPTLPTDTLMRMAPQSVPPFVKVPKVIDEGGGA